MTETAYSRKAPRISSATSMSTIRSGEVGAAFLADVVVRRALTGHVTEQMQRKYSTVGIDEKSDAIAGVFKIVRIPGGDEVGTPSEKQTTGRRDAS